MSINDPEFAFRCMSRIGYYRLSAYWYPFRRFCPLPPDMTTAIRCDRFVEGTTFDDALNFYLFDKEIRLRIVDALERIEIAIRALLVETLGRYGKRAHRDERSYNAWMLETDAKSGTQRLANFLSGLDGAFSRSKEEFAKHFRRTYKGHPPLWIAAGAWDWGNLAYTISGLSDRNKVAVCQSIDARLSAKTLVS